MSAYEEVYAANRIKITLARMMQAKGNNPRTRLHKTAQLNTADIEVKAL